MGDSVFVNKMSAIHKGSPGKSMAFPDVNLCPPSPPAGPVPTPLPNVAQAADLAGGATTVKIDGKPMAKKSSYFAKSTGNAMARSTGGGVVTHVVEGKAYFASFSMNVKVEGEFVPRHLDMMTHNHAAPTPGEAVGTYMGTMQVAMPKVPLMPEPKKREEEDKPFDYEILVGTSTANDASFACVLRSSDGVVEIQGEKGAASESHVTFVFRKVLPAKVYGLLQKVGGLEVPVFQQVPFSLLQMPGESRNPEPLPSGQGEPDEKPEAVPLDEDELDAQFDEYLKGGSS